MDSREFVSFAGRVVALGKAGARSAISRAYYGAFHTAGELIEELTGESLRSGKAHNLVPQYVMSADHDAGNLAARLLSDLHGHRIKADYELSMEFVEATDFAKTQVEAALAVQRHLDEFRSACLADPHLLQQFRDGIARIKAIHKV
jgi:hypothetical protein